MDSRPESPLNAEGIGAPVRRKEDARFLTGRGRFVADLVFPGELHCAFVRSPHAHARFARIDAKAAGRAPGVIAVFTGADMEADKVGPMAPLLASPPIAIVGEPPPADPTVIGE